MPRKHTTRKSTTKNICSFGDIDLSEFTEPYKELQQEYSEILRKKKNKGTPYKVTYKTVPDIAYIVFTTHKDKAKGIATKFFKESYHPQFMGRLWREQHLQARTQVIREFKKYSDTGKIPIPALMQVTGFTFPCSVCHQHNFNYEDYENKKCYVIEGEGDLNEFTLGYILCPECYRRIIKDN